MYYRRGLYEMDDMLADLAKGLDLWESPLVENRGRISVRD